MLALPSLKRKISPSFPIPDKSRQLPCIHLPISCDPHHGYAGPSSATVNYNHIIQRLNHREGSQDSISELLSGIWPKTPCHQAPASRDDSLPHPDPLRTACNVVCTFLNTRYLLALGYLDSSERSRTQTLPWRWLSLAGRMVTTQGGGETPFTLGTEGGGGEGKHFTGNLTLKLALGR